MQLGAQGFNIHKVELDCILCKLILSAMNMQEQK